jgi:hypothetical protein
LRFDRGDAAKRQRHGCHRLARPFGQSAIATKVIPEKRKAYEGIAKLNAKQQQQNGRS